MQLAIIYKDICVHGFDWSLNMILLKVDIHLRFTMMHVWNNHYFNITIGSCKFMQLVITLCNSLILPHFHYCLLLWGSSIKENHLLHLLEKKAVRIIDNSHYIAHTEPICEVHRLLKLPDMFLIALWKFYHKLINNKLPAYFSTLKPRLPEIVEQYEIRNPVKSIKVHAKLSNAKPAP